MRRGIGLKARMDWCFLTQTHWPATVAMLSKWERMLVLLENSSLDIFWASRRALSGRYDISQSVFFGVPLPSRRAWRNFLNKISRCISLCPRWDLSRDRRVHSRIASNQMNHFLNTLHAQWRLRFRKRLWRRFSSWAKQQILGKWQATVSFTWHSRTIHSQRSLAQWSATFAKKVTINPRQPNFYTVSTSVSLLLRKLSAKLRRVSRVTPLIPTIAQFSFFTASSVGMEALQRQAEHIQRISSSILSWQSKKKV